MRLVIVLTLMCVMFGCALTYHDTHVSDERYNPHRPSPRFAFQIIEEFDNGTLSDSGAYYVGRRDVVEGRPDNLQRLLEDLYTRGFEVGRTWYHSGEPCTKHRPNRISGTIYRPFFIIYLSRPDDAMVRYFKFDRIPKPKQRDCKFRVLEFFPVAR